MKECVYGWYPPARNIWKEYRKPKPTYELECLYKFGTSRFVDQPSAATSLEPFHSPITLAARPQTTKLSQSRGNRSPSQSSSKRSQNSRPISQPASYGQNFDHYYESYMQDEDNQAPVHDYEEVVYPQGFTEEQWRAQESEYRNERSHTPGCICLDRPQTVPSHASRSKDLHSFDMNAAARPPTGHSRSCSRSSASPKKPWSTYDRGTPIEIESSPIKSLEPDSLYVEPSPPSGLKSFTQFRAQSASVSRQKTPSSHPRSIKSAVGLRSSSTTDVAREKPSSAASVDRPKTAASVQKPSTAEEYLRRMCKPPSQPPPTPWDPPVFMGKEHEYLPVNEGMRGEWQEDRWAEPLDYEEQLEKYGWRMQVHGDPYNLKRPCLPKRSNFHSAIAMPEYGNPLPETHKESKDVFFYNTIPKQVHTFDVHPKFMSEMIIAKRMELQNREGGVNYRYKNFSFAY